MFNRNLCWRAGWASVTGQNGKKPETTGLGEHTNKVLVLVTASASTKFCCKKGREGEPRKGANVGKKCIYDFGGEIFFAKMFGSD